MELFQKHCILQNSLLILLCCSYITNTSAQCSLDIMKIHVLDACEALFQNDQPKVKRSVPYEHNLVDDDFDSSKTYDKHAIHVRRSNYPPGGYLKVGRDHFQILSKVDVYPRYKAHKRHHEKARYKREHLSRERDVWEFASQERDLEKRQKRYDNIKYCCYNTCKAEMYCSA